MGNITFIAPARRLAAAPSWGMASNRLKELRNRAGLSQARLAKMLGTSTQQISRLEIGDRQLTQGWMNRLAEALNVRPGDFFPDATGVPGNAPAASAPGDDEEFFADTSEALRLLYQELGIKIAPRDLAREAFAAFSDLARESALPETRRHLLGEHIKHHRRFLLRYGDTVLGDRHSA
ncbi:MAG: helix-turn-helix transcriptional regulator [Tistlia sp.]|uniref:helix-turn-helix transcriptional regulator n=1 Tax=Tistlia sp. TaxID=3057121 RepID=UPI0034A3C934